jgi:hypothetical protein
MDREEHVSTLPFTGISTENIVRMLKYSEVRIPFMTFYEQFKRA